MDGTEMGMAVAAAARQALKQKKQELEHAPEAPAATPAPAAADAAAAPPPQRSVCRHEVALAPGFDPASITLDPALHGSLESPAWHGERAKTYPFVLDTFQEQAVACVERGENVLVSAHTSAGKTVVAEYAIAKALAAGQRVFYTSPIKALSNQKFRELSEEFGEVGLMTGDVSINPTAPCIVLTTEILRSMLYKGSDLLREVAWIVFDEVHYMQDRERGVIWEETIIFCPPNARMAFLSATLSNASEFAAWVASVHGAPTHVVYTEFRPTPLKHYAYAPGGAGLHLLVDENGTFRSSSYKRLEAAMGVDGSGGGGGGGDTPSAPPPGRPGSAASSAAPPSKKPRREEAAKRMGDERRRTAGDVKRVLSMVKAREFYPVIVFSFSRREVEAHALAASSSREGPGLDFNTAEEKAAVEAVFAAALGCLSPEDQGLRAVKAVLPLLRAGIGVHHSGLLPLVKEVVEILFQESLIKCLFATETFAMGLNMPARCVVFSSLRKWDGSQSRLLASSEYIQMSGRAGRRGKDDSGLCILMPGEPIEEESLRAMVQGKASPLMSSFKLSYYTLLNLLRRGGGTGEAYGEAGADASAAPAAGAPHDMAYVISRSFAQFQHERQAPLLRAQAEALEARAAALDGGVAGEGESLRRWTTLRRELEAAEAVVAPAARKPEVCLHYLRPGRLVRVREGDLDWGWGVVVSVLRVEGKAGAGGEGGAGPAAAASYLVDTLLCCAGDGGSGAGAGASTNGAAATPSSSEPRPGPPDAPGTTVEVIPAPLPLIAGISSLRVSIPPDLRPREAREAVLSTLRSLMERYPGGFLPMLDPVADQGITAPAVVAAATEAARLRGELAAHPLTKALAARGGSDGETALRAVLAEKAALLTEADAKRRAARDSQLASFREEARNRTAVLRRLGHLDADGAVTLKGRVACEINTADELLTTELMLNGTFLNLDAHQLAALVSCLIQVEKSKESIRLTETLAGPLRALQGAARHIAEVSTECRLVIDAEEYVSSFWPYLMDVIHEWSRGASFDRVSRMTDIFEGSIVRATRRLDELMQELEAAADAIGNETLAAKIKESRETIRRDIMFSASLYI